MKAPLPRLFVGLPHFDVNRRAWKALGHLFVPGNKLCVLQAFNFGSALILFLNSMKRRFHPWGPVHDASSKILINSSSFPFWLLQTTLYFDLPWLWLSPELQVRQVAAPFLLFMALKMHSIQVDFLSQTLPMDTPPLAEHSFCSFMFQAPAASTEDHNFEGRRNLLQVDPGRVRCSPGLDKARLPAALGVLLILEA